MNAGGCSVALSDEVYKCAVHISNNYCGIWDTRLCRLQLCHVENFAIGTTTQSMALAVQVFGQVGVAP